MRTMLFAVKEYVFPQDNDADLDRLEARLRGLLLRGREEDEVDFAVLDLTFVVCNYPFQVTLLTQLEEPAWRTDM